VTLPGDLADNPRRRPGVFSGIDGQPAAILMPLKMIYIAELDGRIDRGAWNCMTDEKTGGNKNSSRRVQRRIERFCSTFLIRRALASGDARRFRAIGAFRGSN